MCVCERERERERVTLLLLCKPVCCCYCTAICPQMVGYLYIVLWYLKVWALWLSQCSAVTLPPGPFRENPTKSETFFISYYPESKKHKQQVASLVQQLRAQGYTVFFDELCKQDIKKSGGLTRWKESCIHSADNIVVVCSPKYYREDEELSNVYAPRRKLSKRHVAVDTHLLRDIAYSGGCGRLIPVVVGRDDPRTCTPLWLQSHVIHRWPHDKVDLLRFITGTPKYELPPVVKKIDLKPLVINFPEAYDWDPYDEEPPPSS